MPVSSSVAISGRTASCPLSRAQRRSDSTKIACHCPAVLIRGLRQHRWIPYELFQCDSPRSHFDNNLPVCLDRIEPPLPTHRRFWTSWYLKTSGCRRAIRPGSSRPGQIHEDEASPDIGIEFAKLMVFRRENIRTFHVFWQRSGDPSRLVGPPMVRTNKGAALSVFSFVIRHPLCKHVFEKTRFFPICRERHDSPTGGFHSSDIANIRNFIRTAKETPRRREDFLLFFLKESVI